MASTFTGTPVTAPTVSTLTFTTARQQIGDYLDWGRSGWDATETSRLGEVLNAGYQQFLYPPPIAGSETGWRWYFLHPVTTLTCTADDYLYDMPSAFGTVIGDLVFDDGQDVTHTVKQVNSAYIDHQRTINSSSGRPLYFAIRPKSVGMTTAQGSELMLYPTPDSAYPLIYQYDATVAEWSTTNEYPLGGQPHNQTILQSCRDIAAQRYNDQAASAEHQIFLERLAASIEYDKRNAPKYMGINNEGRRTVWVRHGTDFSCTLKHNLGGG
jgi:hypothetical protein